MLLWALRLNVWWPLHSCIPCQWSSLLCCMSSGNRCHSSDIPGQGWKFHSQYCHILDSLLLWIELSRQGSVCMIELDGYALYSVKNDELRIMFPMIQVYCNWNLIKQSVIKCKWKIQLCDYLRILNDITK